MTDRELLQMALNALEECYDVQAYPANGETIQDDAIKSLRARLAQPEPEPVAVVSGYYGGHCVILPLNPARIFNANTALYIAPPQREWVGLTDEEIEDLWGEPVDCMWSGNYNAIRDIEAKLKEKNGV